MRNSSVSCSNLIKIMKLPGSRNYHQQRLISPSITETMQQLTWSIPCKQNTQTDTFTSKFQKVLLTQTRLTSFSHSILHHSEKRNISVTQAQANHWSRETRHKWQGGTVCTAKLGWGRWCDEHPDLPLKLVLLGPNNTAHLLPILD